MVPTMAFFEATMGEEPVEQLLARPELKYVSDNFIRQWPATTMQLRTDPVNTAGARRQFLVERRNILKALHEGGVGIVLGSDAPQLWNAPGFSIARELETYVAAGLTPYDALATGTRNVAEFLGNAGEAGTIAAGKRADLILLDANPLVNIGNVRMRAGVMVGGRWLARSEIDRRLTALAFR
jgi:imidazolonepropionase-like amidohydrolase